MTRIAYRYRIKNCIIYSLYLTIEIIELQLYRDKVGFDPSVITEGASQRLARTVHRHGSMPSIRKLSSRVVAPYDNIADLRYRNTKLIGQLKLEAA